MPKSFKGSLSANQIVIIVIALVSFILVMMIVPSIIDEDMTDRVICHTSVVARMTLPDSMFVSLKELPKLNCKTRNVCISSSFFGSGNCDEDFKNEDYETFKITSDKSKRELEINRFVARELADCWDMMGRGEGQVFTREESSKKACSICSRIAFDEDLKKDLKEVKGLGAYLKSYNVPNHNATYLTYLTGKRTLEGYDITKDKFTTDQKAIVFMEAEKGLLQQWVTEGVQTGGGAVIGAMVGSVIPGVGTVVGGVIGFVSGTTIGWFVDSDTNKQDREYQTGWDFVDYDLRNLKGLDCNSFENLA